MTGFGFTFGGLVLLPLAAVSGLGLHGPGPVTLGPAGRARHRADRRGVHAVFPRPADAPAGTAALLALLEPLTATLLAALLLGDRLGPAGSRAPVILAAALVLAAVAGQGAASRDTPGRPGPGQATARRTTAVAQPRTSTHTAEHGERLPHGGAGGAGRQHPGGGDR